MKKVLILSGGMDSTTLLWELFESKATQADRADVHCLTFDYGQRHLKEIDCARTIARDIAGVPWNLADMTGVSYLLRKEGAIQVDKRAPVPEGHYAAETMKATVSPNRNMIMLSIAVGHAVAIGAEEVYYAAHAGDHDIYPDCRPVFVNAMIKAIQLGNAWTPVKLKAPYLQFTKAQIVDRALKFGAPLRHTWSCYKGQALACGRCGTCVERLEAFALNKVEDPIDYQDRTSWRAYVKRATKAAKPR